MKREGGKWKTIAIIFIILFALTISLLIWLLATGSEIAKNENICAINICGDDKYTAYYYDDIDEICSCYEGNEITHEQVITGNSVRES